MHTLRILALAGLVTLAGCGAVTGSDSTDSELARAEARWQRLGNSSYNFRLTTDCYCANAGRELIVYVRAGRVQLAIEAGSGRVLTDADGYTPTIQRLFDRIEEAQRLGTHVEVRYNSEYGYPEVAVIGELANDSGTRYSVREVLLPLQGSR